MENGLERDTDALQRQMRLQEDLIDSLDEELEMELDDWRVGNGAAGSDSWHAQRRLYFRELLRLQGELVKLQDWVMHGGHRLVVLFEGRDAAGKGGVIKRITQRLNPGCAGWPRCPRRPRANARNGISSAMPRTCPPPARSSCSTAAGTTGPGWSA